MATALILGDITGRSRVAVRMLTSVLEARGHEVLALPTALISNTLNLGRHVALDTTDYLLKSLETWEALGLSWDCVLIGYVTGLAQAQKLCEIADAARARGAWVLVDPILGDGGQMYNSVTSDQAEGMRLLARHADIVTPNLTEARLLTATGEDAGGEALLWALSAQGKRSALITSAELEGGASAIIGYDAKTDSRFCIPFERAEGRHFGTGDLFSAHLADRLLRGRTLGDAAREANDAVGRAIRGEGEKLPR